MNLATLLQGYAQTWLPLNLILVVGEWAEVAAQHSAGSVWLVQAVAMLRVARLARLARSTPFTAWLRKVLECHARSEKALIILGVLKLMLLITAFNHIITCLWYGMSSGWGLPGQVVEEGWVKSAGLDEATLSQRYAASSSRNFIVRKPRYPNKHSRD